MPSPTDPFTVIGDAIAAHDRAVRLRDDAQERLDIIAGLTGQDVAEA